MDDWANDEKDRMNNRFNKRMNNYMDDWANDKE